MPAFLRLLRVTGWTLLVLLMASFVVSGVLVGVVNEFAHDGVAQFGHWHVVVDGEDIGTVMGLRDGLDFDADEGFGAFLGLFLGMVAVVFCLLVVVPLTLLLGIGVPMLGVLFALGAVAVALAGVAVLVAGPLLLPILLVVWLLRRDRRPTVTHPVSA